MVREFYLVRKGSTRLELTLPTWISKQLGLERGTPITFDLDADDEGKYAIIRKFNAKVNGINHFPDYSKRSKR